MPPRPTVLLTEGASLSARQTLYALGPLCTIDVIDPDPLCQCRFSRFVRSWTRSPSFSKEPEQFLEFLVQKIVAGKYDVLLPTHEQVYLLSRFKDSFSQHVGLALPEFRKLEQMQDKAQFMQLLDQLGLPHPEVAYVRTRQELEQSSWTYPFYLKLAHSTAGSGVFYIENQEQLAARAKALSEQGLFDGPSEIVLQQPAKGVQSTVQAVFNKGQLVGIHMFESRRLGVGGMSAARTSAEHPVVRQQVEQLGQHLDWHGSTFIDYFYDHASGQPEYIEANPRIGETVNGLLSGVNLCEQLVKVSCGEEVSPLPPSKTGIRTQSFYMILMDMANKGCGRRELLREVWRYLRSKGLYHDSEDDLTRVRDDRLSRLPFLWITLQLIAWPALGKKIVAKTVNNYSLPEAATLAIKALPADLVEKAFQRNE